MDEKGITHVRIKFCFKLGEIATRTREILKIAYAELSKNGRQMFSDDQQSGSSPTTITPENIAKVKKRCSCKSLKNN